VVAQRSGSWSTAPTLAITVSVPPSSVARPAPKTRRRAPAGSPSSESIRTTACPPRSTRRFARSTASSAACACASGERSKLPPETEKGKGYDFTFHEQRVKANLSSAGFPMTPELLAQVAAICDVLFKAQVTEIMNIRRVRPTADDPPGQPDYTEQSVITNSVLGVVIFPYEIHLKIDPKDVGQLLEGFYKSPHGFVLRYFSTQMPGSVSTEIRQSTPAVAPKPKPFGKPGGATATEGAVSPRVLGRQNVQLGIFLDVVKPLPGLGNR